MTHNTIIDRAALEAHLLMLTGQELRGSLHFSPDLDLTQCAGAAVYNLAQLLRREAERPAPSRQVIASLRDAVCTAPPERVMHLRYESILENPEPELRRFIRFLDPSLEQDAWFEKVIPMVKSNPAKWTKLPLDERARLEAACAPGMAIAARLGAGRARGGFSSVSGIPVIGEKDRNAASGAIHFWSKVKRARTLRHCDRSITDVIGPLATSSLAFRAWRF
ncbi:MAG: hypothetical protein IPM54_19730 [Polyangiaceae bacterium]|nr:hypothetical protein [Polyangiaceae bacterium]